MATAGRPLSGTPSRAGARSSHEKFGASAAGSDKRADAVSDSAITALRLPASDSEPATISIGASTPVVSDSARLLVAAETPNSATKTGISGWTQYSSAKVAKPAA